MKLILNKFFLSRKSARKTVAIGYIFSIVTFLGAMLVYYEYSKYGYFLSRRTIIPGDDALFTAIALLAVSIAFFLFAIYLCRRYPKLT